MITYLITLFKHAKFCYNSYNILKSSQKCFIIINNTTRGDLRMLWKSYKNGFTLAELLIAIGIIGLIAAITLPLLRNSIPNKDEATKKKADYLVEQIVNQLYEDDVMYPKNDSSRVGFQNTDKVSVQDPNYKSMQTYEGNDKFCRLFASRMVIASGSKIVCENEKAENATTLALGKKSFTAKDGIEWYLPVTNFSKGAARIMIDVNGPDGKNCIKGDKYKDSLGLEHTCSAKDADRFIYYVKTNGTITLQNPTNVQKTKFKINVNVTTEGCSEASCSSDGGTVEIAHLGTDTQDNASTTYSGNASAFQNLSPNTKYMLKAKPKTGYYTSWSINKKRVTVYSGDVDVDLKFYKRKTHCVTLDVNDCDKDEATSCVTAKLATECKYTEQSGGPYQLNDDGVYEYVGLGVGTHVYSCTGNKIAGSKGRPKIDSATGKVSSYDYSKPSIHWCGLLMNDYRIEASGKSPYTVRPNDDYEQDVRLGTESLFFNTSVYK